MHSNRGYKRAERVGENVKRALSVALSTIISDPRLKGAMITSVEISDDLKNAWVKWHLATRDTPERIAAGQKALDSACNRLRKELSRAVALKVTPALKFKYDEGIDAERHIERLLADVDIPEASDEE